MCIGYNFIECVSFENETTATTTVISKKTTGMFKFWWGGGSLVNSTKSAQLKLETWEVHGIVITVV